MPPKAKAIKINVFWLFVIPMAMCIVLFTLYITSTFHAMSTYSQAHSTNSHAAQHQKIMMMASNPAPPPPPMIDTTAIIRSRDRMVDEDRLYPPYDRNTVGVARQYIPEKMNGTFNYATRETSDEFRMIGYLSNSGTHTDQGGNTWKLYGRETHRGSGAAEFYVIPANRNYDIKLFVNNGMLQTNSERLRGIYDIPSSVSFNHPMFSKDPYHLELLPKSDMQSQYI